MECHVKPGLLLIWKVVDDELRLARIGSHAKLFR
jgi:mRNA-degrading endonuclease YafQ of YafQ-DinJ toxin-antitoxin module